jgi:CRP-like cAMP-binding protein
MSCYGQQSVGNEILMALPIDSLQHLLSRSRIVKLGVSEVVCESNACLDSICFPTSSVVSLIYTLNDGASAEIGVVGSDGIIGYPFLLGGMTAPSRAVTLIAGEAIFVTASTVEDEFSRGGPLQRLLLRYLHAFITQVSLTAVCNRLHSMEKRLCRLLLLCQDRIHSDELTMTQDFIGQTLGGRRETVTVAAGELQDAGLIRYSRGHIRILDQLRLRANACECYRVMKTESDRLERCGKKSMATSLTAQECVSRMPSAG